MSQMAVPVPQNTGASRNCRHSCRFARAPSRTTSPKLRTIMRTLRYPPCPRIPPTSSIEHIPLTGNGSRPKSCTPFRSPRLLTVIRKLFLCFSSWIYHYISFCKPSFISFTHDIGITAFSSQLPHHRFDYSISYRCTTHLHDTVWGVKKFITGH